jgi:hypothetical protein
VAGPVVLSAYFIKVFVIFKENFKEAFKNLHHPGHSKMNKSRACLEAKIVRHYAKQGLEKFISENLNHINKLREEENYKQLNRISSHFRRQEDYSIRKEII